ncbi:MAG: histidine phosphatase family protein [Candidatus Bathyarchaeota archaeon]|nr:MAG: histidine phosphatase family protein [Candidatus Bathyarchaeota archaeon]
MVQVLGSVDWGGPALALLAHCSSLDGERPAVIHIRHTERPLIEEMVDGKTTVSTETGKEAAYEFGRSLPCSRRYRFFHSYYERARETAVKIHEGVLDGGGSSEVLGSVSLASVLNHEAYYRHLSRFSDTEYHAQGYFYRWVSGHFPPEVLMPSMEFAKKGAEIMMGNLRSGGSDSFDVYASHDTWVAAFMFHWFGLLPSREWVKFLDGFIVQFSDEGMTVYSKEGRMEVDFPHWWEPL